MQDISRLIEELFQHVLCCRLTVCIWRCLDLDSGTVLPHLVASSGIGLGE
jgi:hypothetical protein